MKGNSFKAPPENRFHSVDIFDVAFPNNYGVGKIDGYVLFVPGALPLDRVRVEVAGYGKRFGYGKLISIEEPSPLRVDPPCPHFDLCGGCTLQNLSYDKQLDIKENYLRQTLKRLGGIDIDGINMLSIVPSPELAFYRTKLELAFGEKDGEVILGLRERVSPFEQYSGRVVPIHRCEIFSPHIEKIVSIFVEFARSLSLAPYNPATRKGFLRHLIIRESKATGELMFVLETTTGTLPDPGNLWQTLVSEIPQTSSFFSAINNTQSDVIRIEKITHLGGRLFIEERLGDCKFHIYPRSFFQPNAKAAARIFAKIPDLASLNTEETMFGLYCGAGPIEIFLSPFVKSVTGFDSLPENITNAVENCRINERTNCSFHNKSVESLLNDTSIHKPDVLILDPPRGGISPKAMRIILALRTRKIIYISCNPSTLARDLKLFREAAYTINTIMPLDFFPHTSHLETLVYLDNS